MATITHGSVGRTDVSSHTKTIQERTAKYKKLVIVKNEDFFATGSSNDNPSAFIIDVPGNSVFTPLAGEQVRASELTGSFAQGTPIELGVQRISGSGTIHVLYKY